MKPSKKFTVQNPSEAFAWLLALVAVSAGVIVMNLIFSDENPTAMIVTFSLIVFLPCGWAMLWVKVKKITVNADTVTVRKMTGRKYSFSIHDVTYVKWNTTVSRMGRIEAITMKIGKRTVLDAGMPMLGFEKLAAYTQANVEESKIHRTHKVMKNAMPE